MKKIKIIVEKTSTGYSAYADKYPVFTTGSSVNELMKNIIEAVNFYFVEAREKIEVSQKNLDVQFSIPSLFNLYPINVRHFAERIGMNYTLLSQYVQGRKRPSSKQTEKIVEGLQEIGRELSDVKLI
ncbi:MAG: helix-turn-helix transcriptional regulator [Bacteroidota bacterium]